MLTRVVEERRVADRRLDDLVRELVRWIPIGRSGLAKLGVPLLELVDDALIAAT